MSDCGPLVLSLFPGIGLLDMAFEQEGFCVVRGPDVLWGGDIRRFHPPAGKFDGIIGGPPCQAFSRLAHMVRQNGYKPKFGNLIPEFERCVAESQPQWFVMENVPDAPRPGIPGYETHPFFLNLRWLKDENGKPCVPNRLRAWTFGIKGSYRPLLVQTATLEHMEFEYAATGGSYSPNRLGNGQDPRRKKMTAKRSALPFNAKSWSAVQELCRKQGLPTDFLKHTPFTVEAACKAVGNGVPLPMGRAIARAVKEAIGEM